MKTPEGKVKDQVKGYLELKGVWYFMPVSNGMGRHGIPDIIVCAYGCFLAIECKAGNGKVTALQEREMQRIQAAGGYAIVVNDDIDTFEELICILDLMKKHG